MITLAYGLPGTGKSTLLHDLVRAQADTQTFLISDHEAGWGPEALHWRNDPPDNITIVQGQDEFEKLTEGKIGDFGLYVIRNVEGVEIAALAASLGNVVYVDDELDKAGRRQGFDESALRGITNEGRHLPNSAGDICQVHILGACRRPQKLHTDLTDLADQVYVFRIMGKNTMKRLSDDLYLDPSDEANIRELPDFHFWHWPSRQFMAVRPIGKPRGKGGI